MNRLDTNAILQQLQTGAIEIEGALPWSSNYSFLVRVPREINEESKDELTAVYKPSQGERPLWDFATGTLCRREVAAFLVSDALGWNLVPPTVLRQGPYGLGSLQLFIKHDPECHYFTVEGSEIYRRPLQQIAIFDILINNADRKGGHVLLEEIENPIQSDKLWAIDHGVCFHSEYKLRTVVWEFAGMVIPSGLLANLLNFKNKFAQISPSLNELLTDKELVALQKRLDRIIQRPIFISPGPGRHYPWPPI